MKSTIRVAPFAVAAVGMLAGCGGSGGGSGTAPASAQASPAPVAVAPIVSAPAAPPAAAPPAGAPVKPPAPPAPVASSASGVKNNRSGSSNGSSGGSNRNGSGNGNGGGSGHGNGGGSGSPKPWPLALHDSGAAVKKIEESLKKLGLKPGKSDGKFTTATEKAVRIFQKKHGIPVTGTVNQPTAKRIAEALRKQSTAWADAIIREARKHLGFHEKGNNGNPFSHFFKRPDEAWCADFVSYCYTKGGSRLNYAGTDAMYAHFRRIKTFHKGNPKPGEVIFFDWSRGNSDPTEHVGIVEKVTKSAVHTIEGNSSDRVQRNVYSRGSPVIVGYGTVR